VFAEHFDLLNGRTSNGVRMFRLVFPARHEHRFVRILTHFNEQAVNDRKFSETGVEIGRNRSASDWSWNERGSTCELAITGARSPTSRPE
jgi:hypothetical protein